MQAEFQNRNVRFDPDSLLEEYGDYLFRYALVRVRNRDVAEDMVQETLLAAVRGKEQYRGQASVRTWLVGIVKHKILDYFRKRQREHSFDATSSEASAGNDLFDSSGKWKTFPSHWSESPAKLLEKKEFWEKFESCMTQMPERLANIFGLRELDGLETAEICKILDISTTNLHVMLYRARMRLARCLDANWFEREQRKKGK
ncbi:MAG: sigma-70 family RNA polymerase sigma factor [Candidatus Abyssobacteria bacterium SURF_5]|uniref:Sigma-70 family RNA polymerase sigma factor n=1 Tax=Abyssobacteria bacterium (strain SURF_5) TaxID=2093360 RepID=A0A3A4NHL5_ABYX5|nr:MAG: sigma-70 family RNA polymerase sigma factor [Candidatus Abyssubacteria bacterium SURF_5]